MTNHTRRIDAIRRAIDALPATANGDDLRAFFDAQVAIAHSGNITLILDVYEAVVAALHKAHAPTLVIDWSGCHD
jgi:hypothetical protein